MANSLYKWCKSKLNGYKHMPAGSHSEFGSEFRSENTLREEFQMSEERHENHIPRPDNCEVDVSPSNNPQEFAFTLYDFDGPDQVTKDDIVGLAQAIYDALGSALQVTAGCRTVTVNLTVRPENNFKPRDSPQRDERIPVLTPTESPLRRRHRHSVHRQELFQIIRDNMERNNLFYPSVSPRRKHRRKHCKCCPNTRYHEPLKSLKSHTTPVSPRIPPPYTEQINDDSLLSFRYKNSAKYRKHSVTWIKNNNQEPLTSCSQSYTHQHFHHHFHHNTNPIII